MDTQTTRYKQSFRLRYSGKKKKAVCVPAARAPFFSFILLEKSKNIQKMV
jgi:hypothetical protein